MDILAHKKFLSHGFVHMFIRWLHVFHRCSIKDEFTFLLVQIGQVLFCISDQVMINHLIGQQNYHNT